MIPSQEVGGSRVIVLGNEKGGSGKSTSALHLIVALLKRGFKVGSIDLDARQGTLSRMIENRGNYAQATGRTLVLPEHRRVARSEAEAELQAKAGMPVPAPGAETEAAEAEDDGEERATEAPAAEAMFENAGGEESGEGAGADAETGADADGDVKEEGAGGAGKATD